MKKLTPLIDFSELSSSRPGEALEELTRQIGVKKHLSPTWSGRGADQGRDLFFTEVVTGPLSKYKIKWLVSCKDKAKGGSSVLESDLPATGIKDKLSQHQAEGFLLVTTSTVSTGAKALIDSLDKSVGGEVYTKVWDLSELSSILLEPSNQDLLKQFLPESYLRVRQLDSLETTVLQYKDQLPDEIFDEVLRLVGPYARTALKGERVWPYNKASGMHIDRIVKALLIDNDQELALNEVAQIESDVLLALATELYSGYPDECFEFLSLIIIKQVDADLAYNAYQFLADTYNLTRTDILKLAPYVDDESSLIESDEVKAFVPKTILEKLDEFELSKQLSLIPDFKKLNKVDIEWIVYEIQYEKRIEFFGCLLLTISLASDKNVESDLSIPGEFSGYFNEMGIFIESASSKFSKSNTNVG